MAYAIIRMTNPVTVTAAGGRKSLLGVEPTSNGPCHVVAIRNAGKSVNAADKPVRLILAQWDTAGTRTAKTPVPVDPSVVAAGLRFTGAESYSVEPTTNEVIKHDKLFPPSMTEWEPTVNPVDGTPLIEIAAGKFGVLSATPEAGGNDQQVLLEMLVRD